MFASTFCPWRCLKYPHVPSKNLSNLSGLVYNSPINNWIQSPTDRFGQLIGIALRGKAMMAAKYGYHGCGRLATSFLANGPGKRETLKE